REPYEGGCANSVSCWSARFSDVFRSEATARQHAHCVTESVALGQSQDQLADRANRLILEEVSASTGPLASEFVSRRHFLPHTRAEKHRPADSQREAEYGSGTYNSEAVPIGTILSGSVGMRSPVSRLNSSGAMPSLASKWCRTIASRLET